MRDSGCGCAPVVEDTECLRLVGSDHLVGALIVTTAVIELADVGRAMRFLNIVFGAWVIAAPWLLGGATPASRWSDAIAAALVIMLSLPRGPVGERYGIWHRYIR